MEDIYDTQSMAKGLHGIMQMISCSSLNALYKKLEDAANRIDEPMQLAIIGKISSSKSTLVNAILGKNEIMATGQKEVTYNVGWLKYGNPDSDIIIHHKDNSPAIRKNPKEFAMWSTESHDSEIDNISYIEIFDDAEILKEINIIDTPGLDALRGKDSQNTLDFIQKVRPDAVIMLFTHSVSENVLDIVRQYNAGSSFNPLNAIGVLAKIDVLWQETLDRDKTALQIGERLTKNKIKKDPSLQKTLFNIFPISALQFLASSTLDESTFAELVNLSKSDDAALKKAFNSVTNFLKPEVDLNVEATQRKLIIEKIGLYGAYLIVKSLKSEEVSDVQSARRLLWKESGAQGFMKVLHNHFGMRAKLIKMESVYQSIQQTIMTLRGQIKDTTSLQVLSKVEQRISELFSCLVHEHKEYDLLYKLYNDEIIISDNDKREFFSLGGEYGSSAPERLGLTSVSTAQDLIDKALEREKYWRKQVALEPDPEEREWMNIILTSYSRLRHKLQLMKYQYEQSKAFLFNE